MLPARFPPAGRAAALAAAALVTAFIPGWGRALEFIEGTPSIEPADVALSRTVTLRVLLKDESGETLTNLAVEAFPDPAPLVKLESSRPAVSLTCTAGGRYEGTWTFRASAPGTAKFRVTAFANRCSDLTVSSAEKTSRPLSIRPAEIASTVRVVPRVAAPGDLVEVDLMLRNDGRDDALFTIPRADPDHPGQATTPLGPAARSAVEPPSLVRDGRIVLAAGASGTFRWWFPARDPGQSKVTIIGAGLLIKSPAILVRPAGALAVSLEAPRVPAAEEREYEFRGRVRSAGGVAVVRPRILAGIRPEGAARLISAELSSTATLLPEEAAALTVRAELVKPGILTLTVTVEGEEADSGRTVGGAAAAALSVLPPPDLVMKVSPSSDTVLTGNRLDFTVEAYNPTASAAQNITPVLVVKEGKADPGGFQPIFLTVTPRTRVKFRGSLVPREAGRMSFGVMATARGERGGRRISAESPPASVTVVPAPRFALTPLSPRAFSGSSSTLRFLVTNTVSATVTIKGAGISLAGEGMPISGVRAVKPSRLVLAPGASATLALTAYLGATPAPYQVQGAFMASGTAGKLPFTAGSGQRWLVLACPADAGIIIPGSDSAYSPPAMSVEWSMTRQGEAAVEIVAPGGAIARTLKARGPMAKGFHSAVWTGEGDDGAFVAPGRYVLRLAGPVSGTAGRFSWTRERVVQVR